MTDERLTNEDESLSEEQPESVHDTALRTWEELGGKLGDTEERQADAPGGEDEGAKEPAVSEVSKAASTLAKSRRRPRRSTVEAADLEPLGGKAEATPSQPESEAAEERLEPPVRFSVAEKEWFNQQPKEMQRSISRTFEQIEAHATKLFQETNRHKARYESLDQVEQHYRTHLDRHGLDFASGTRQLWAVHQALANDPDAELLRLIEQNGRTLEQLYNVREGRGGKPAQQHFSPQPQNNPLTEDRIAPIIETRIQQHFEQQRLAQEEAANVQESEAVRREVGPDGRYTFPELWDDKSPQTNYWNMGFIERVQPLVQYFRKTQPLGEALKSAIRLSRGQAGSPSPTSPGLSPQQEIATVRAASVSVRPKGNGAIQTGSPAKKGESVRDSATKLYDQFFPNN